MDYKDFEAGYHNDSFWLKGKRKLVEVIMNKLAGKRKGLKILNIGAGTGGDLHVLKKFGSNYVLDIDKKSVDIIDPNLCVEKKVADAQNIPYKNNYFDVVIASDVLEHIGDDHKAVAEIRRVLKKDGFFIFTVPAFQFLFSSHDRALGHLRRYHKKDVIKLLRQFNNLRIFYWNSLLFPPSFFFRILRKKAKSKVDYIPTPDLINFLLFKLISIDNFLIKKEMSAPIGMSIVGYCYKR